MWSGHALAVINQADELLSMLALLRDASMPLNDVGWFGPPEGNATQPVVRIGYYGLRQPVRPSVISRTPSVFQELSRQGDRVEHGESAGGEQGDGHPLGGGELVLRCGGDPHEDLWHA